MATLQEQLDRIRENAKKRIPTDALAVMDQAREALTQSGIMERMLKPGETAPPFSLENFDGKVISSAELLRNGPMVVVFYRGKWWPYCNAELAALQRVLPDIETAGASLVAISPQLPEYSREMANLQKLSFPLLYDKHNETARQFRLVFDLPDDLRQVYRSIGVDLEKYNGDSSWGLAIPGVYVIGRDSRVKYASADPDYTTRPEPQAIIDALRALWGLAY